MCTAMFSNIRKFVLVRFPKSNFIITPYNYLTNKISNRDLTLVQIGYSLRTTVKNNSSTQKGPQWGGRDLFGINLLDDLFIQVMTLLLISGCGAATAVGYVGKYGEDHMGWSAICDHVNKFCKTNLASLLLSYFSFFAYLGLTILTAYKCTSSPL